MSYRKGELSPSAIDRGWPHQVALRADFVAGRNHEIIEKAKRELGGCDRGHAVRHNDTDYIIYCFAEPQQADTFRDRFGGEPFSPKDRGRGASWWRWNRPTEDTHDKDTSRRSMRSRNGAAARPT